LLRDGSGAFSVLRLYRQGRAPKPEIFQRLVEVSHRLDGLAVRVLEAGYDEATGRWFETQEYLPEGDLAGLLKNGPLSPNSLRELISELAEALVNLHKQDILHRDIKPDNILIRSRQPLKIALSDFGISSLLAPDISIKETRMANTPLYSSPESFGSIIGKAADWWSLGAVILEAATGSHPLSSLSFNEVLREISTRGLRVPENLPEGLTQLLKGLLTRDDKKRWRYHEVLGWLMGQRDIPIHYEVPELDRANVPYTLDGQEFKTPEELAAYFASSEAAWEKGRDHLARGYIRQWLENRKMFDEAVRAQTDTISAEAAIFNFILAFAPQKGPVYQGQILSFQNIARLVAKSGQSSSGGQKIIRDLLEGRLAPLVSLAKARKKPFDELTAALFSHGKQMKIETLTAILTIAQNPEAYVWGQGGVPPRSADIVRFVAEAGCPLLERVYWETNVPAKAIIPKDIFEGGLNQAQTYRLGVERLARLVKEGVLTKKFLRRSRPLESLSLGLIKVSPLTTEQMTVYARWLTMDRASQELDGFEPIRAIDALERGAWPGRTQKFLNLRLWISLAVFALLTILPLTWALDGLRLIQFNSFSFIPLEAILKYRGIQRAIFNGAGIALTLGIVAWVVCRWRNFVAAFILAASAAFAIYRHQSLLNNYLVYLSWVVHGGVFLLALLLANWARKLIRWGRRG
jgi:serine/threonine protein kinase